MTIAHPKTTLFIELIPIQKYLHHLFLNRNHSLKVVTSRCFRGSLTSIQKLRISKTEPMEQHDGSPCTAFLIRTQAPPHRVPFKLASCATEISITVFQLTYQCFKKTSGK